MNGTGTHQHQRPEEASLWRPTAQALFPGRLPVGTTGQFMFAFLWVEGRCPGRKGRREDEIIKKTVFSRS